MNTSAFLSFPCPNSKGNTSRNSQQFKSPFHLIFPSPLLQRKSQFKAFLHHLLLLPLQLISQSISQSGRKEGNIMSLVVMSSDHQHNLEMISRPEQCGKAKGVPPPVPQSARQMVRRRIPSNKELLRRALSPPVRRRGPPGLRRWTFRPMPSRLRNMSLDD